MARTSRLADWLGRRLTALMMWRDRRYGPPNVADAIKRDSDWDYDQADLQEWDDEPDVRGLSNAFALRMTDPAGAFAMLPILAEENSPRAMNAIGEDFYWGHAGSIDRAKGEAWFKLAFEHGSRRGLLNLGKALIWRSDLDGAEAVFQVGADADWAPAFYWLAQIQLRRPRRQGRMLAVRLLLQRALDGGSLAARVQLDAFMTAGRYGLKNVPRGLQLMSEDNRSILDPENTTELRPAANETAH